MDRDSGINLLDAELVHAKLSANKPQLGWSDEPLVCDRHTMELAIEIARPEVEELLEAREAGMDVVVLPDIRLQERGMIWHPVKDLCRRQAEASELCSEIAVR